MAKKKKADEEEKKPAKKKATSKKKTQDEEPKAVATPQPSSRQDSSGILEYKQPGELTALTKARGVVDALFSKKESPIVALDTARYDRPYPTYSSGSIVLDYQIGGRPNAQGIAICNGFPRGRVINLFGPEGSGKTTIALSTAKAICGIGGGVGYLDWENAISPHYAKEMGLPVDNAKAFELVQPDTLEDGFKILWAWANCGVDLIVIDSVGAGVPQAIFGQKPQEVGEMGQVGLLARKWSYFLPKLQRVIRKSGTVLLAISQTRKNIGVTYGDSDQAQGGEAWKFYSSIRIKLLTGKLEMVKKYNPILNEEEEVPIGMGVTAKLIKNKMTGNQKITASFYIRFGVGVDNVRSLLEIGKAQGFVQSGGYPTWKRPNGSTVRVQGGGLEKLRQAIVEQRLTDELYHQVIPYLEAPAGQPATQEVEEEDLEGILDDDGGDDGDAKGGITKT